MPNDGDPSGGSGVLAIAPSSPCRTHPLPTSSMGEAPLLGSVQPRSAARNFAIYEQGGRVPLALAASVLDPCQSWGGQGGPKLVDPWGGRWGSVSQGRPVWDLRAFGELAAAAPEVPG